MALTSDISISTENASGYLQRLCKHFGHKREVEFKPTEGRISFEFGTATLVARPDGLKMTALAETQDDLARLKRVMASHLERFAFREELDVKWN